MAKLVSEKREIVTPQRTQAGDIEPRTSPLVAAFGAGLTALFVLGAVAMVFVAFGAKPAP